MNELSRLIKKMMDAPVRSCDGCPYYLHKEYIGQTFCRDLRANFCAHPAYIESYGVEQYNGHTKPGIPCTTRTCILDENGDLEELMHDSKSVGHIHDCELHGPKLSSVSTLWEQPDHYVSKLLKLPPSNDFQI